MLSANAHARVVARRKALAASVKEAGVRRARLAAELQQTLQQQQQQQREEAQAVSEWSGVEWSGVKWNGDGEAASSERER